MTTGISLLTPERLYESARVFLARSSGQSFDASAETDILWDAPLKSIGFTYDVGTGELTALADGDYSVNCAFRNTGTVTLNDIVELRLRVNGNLALTRVASSGLVTPHIRVSGNLRNIKRGDKIKASLLNNHSASLTNRSTETEVYFHISRIPDYSTGSPIGFALAGPDSPGLVRLDGVLVASDQDLTLTADDPRIINFTNTGGARDIILPSSGVRAGDRYRLIYDSTTSSGGITTQSSNSDAIEPFMHSGAKGHIVVIALQDNPTTKAHWYVEDNWMILVRSLDQAGVESGQSIKLERRGDAISLSYNVPDSSGSQVTLTSNQSSFDFGALIPTRFRPRANVGALSTITGAGIRAFEVTTDGKIETTILDWSGTSQSVSSHGRW